MSILMYEEGIRIFGILKAGKERDAILMMFPIEEHENEGNSNFNDRDMMIIL